MNYLDISSVHKADTVFVSADTEHTATDAQLRFWLWIVSVSLRTQTRHFSLQSVVWNYLHPDRQPKAKKTETRRKQNAKRCVWCDCDWSNHDVSLRLSVIVTWCGCCALSSSLFPPLTSNIITALIISIVTVITLMITVLTVLLFLLLWS